MARTVEFTDTEFMIAQGARLIEDGKTIFVGWGIPQAVAMLAQKLYVPNVTQLFEFGGIGPQSAPPSGRGGPGVRCGAEPFRVDQAKDHFRHRHEKRKMWQREGFESACLGGVVKEI